GDPSEEGGESAYPPSPGEDAAAHNLLDLALSGRAASAGFYSSLEAAGNDNLLEDNPHMAEAREAGDATFPHSFSGGPGCGPKLLEHNLYMSDVAEALELVACTDAPGCAVVEVDDEVERTMDWKQGAFQGEAGQMEVDDEVERNMNAFGWWNFCEHAAAGKVRATCIIDFAYAATGTLDLADDERLLERMYCFEDSVDPTRFSPATS
ncbi:hypothetical protein T484DRAFT_1802798, partial [Baffinella frigidus]